MMLVRVVSKYYVAGLVVEDGVITAFAPILRAALRGITSYGYAKQKLKLWGCTIEELG